MCCIFTCCGWLIDLFQRAWVFAMSFCMSGAICCVLMLGSMSGVALGYNYSLAEYMDLKETNVSVYLKRGVFDDDGLGDDMNFRRSGEEEEGFDQVPKPQRRAGEGKKGDDSSTLISGRRLDDSLLQSNQNHGYEGSLMKLTMAPPFSITTSTPMSLRDESLSDIFLKHAPDSLDQLKEIQSLINYRKALAARDPGNNKDEQVLLAGKPAYLIGEQNYVPPHILNAQPSPGRRAWQAPSTSSDQFNTLQNYLPRKIHPALIAVPPPGINQRENWEAYKSSQPLNLEFNTATPPLAIRMNTLDQDMFPTEPLTVPVFREGSELPPTQQTPTEFVDLGLDASEGQFDQKSILEKYETRTKSYEGLRGKEVTAPKLDNEYYDDDIKGLPVRRKRHIHRFKRKSVGQNTPRSEQLKSNGENTDKGNPVSHKNDISNTDPSILVSKLVPENKVNTKAKDLIIILEKTPLYDKLINNTVNETESRFLMRGLLGKTSVNLNKINQKLHDASSAEPDFINQRRFVFSFA